MIDIDDIATAVTAEINAAPEGTFASAITAVDAYAPVYELADMDTLHVTVMPAGVEETLIGRNQSQLDIRVHVAVQQKISGDDDALDAAVAALMALTGQVRRYLRARRLTAQPTAAWIEIANNPIYVPDHLRDYRQFTSVLTVTYRVIEAMT